jgi:hypothetical protein
MIMGKFLKAEKNLQADFKVNSSYFSDNAHADGVYKNHPYPFCIPRQYADQNLFAGIRHSAIKHFNDLEIKWHDGQKPFPSNHMCDSQVCCVNFLFPFADQPAALGALLKPFYRQLSKMLPIEKDLYVTFEWIGVKNYLGEKISKSGKRTRGANFTSTDAAVLFDRQDGTRQVVLIEWKYCESYYSTPLHVSKSGTRRTEIYQHLFDAPDCPIDKDLLPDYDDLFYEPFYQFMRQQFLAHEMEKAEELKANIVSLLHISPAANSDFRRITSPRLQNLGESATQVWSKLVKGSSRFLSVSTEEMFGAFPIHQYQVLDSWWEYIRARYSWVGKGDQVS